MVTAEAGSNHLARTGENFFLEEWQDIISRLPSDFQKQAQKLPENCQRNVILLAATCHQLADEFPPYPLTPYDFAQVSGQLERRTSFFAKGLDGWGDRPFIDIWLKKHKLLKAEIEKSGRKELAVALSELISQDAQNRFAGANPDSPLLSHCLEATRSFVAPCADWAIISDQIGFGKNFFLLTLPIYRLGVSVIEIGNCGGDEILVAQFPYITEGRGEIGTKFLAAPLKTRGFLIDEEAGQ